MRKRFSSSDWFKLVIAVVVAEFAGIIGSVFTISAIPTWYAMLAKPALNPPSWIFGPVWTMLYILMGIAAFLVWRKGWNSKGVKTALSLFGLQLVLNALWSIIFFGLHNPAWALVDIIAMWIVIVATIAVFARISRSAAWLLAPYIAWVSFALYLNYAIWRLN